MNPVRAAWPSFVVSSFGYEYYKSHWPSFNSFVVSVPWVMNVARAAGLALVHLVMIVTRAAGLALVHLLCQFLWL